jgi:hypothetical protein
VHDVQSSSIEADIARLDAGIRRLKIQYDMFFAGALPREPFELRNELDHLVRRASKLSIRKYAHRFHLNTLIARYNAMSELWGKTMRSREEGDRPPAQLADRRAALDTSCRLADGDGPTDELALRRLHREFESARRRRDSKAKSIGFDHFVRGIQDQAARLRRKTGCGDVELRVVEKDGAVQLKARPARS